MFLTSLNNNKKGNFYKFTINLSDKQTIMLSEVWAYFLKYIAMIKSKIQFTTIIFAIGAAKETVQY